MVEWGIQRKRARARREGRGAGPHGRAGATGSGSSLEPNSLCIYAFRGQSLQPPHISLTSPEVNLSSGIEGPLKTPAECAS